MSTDTPPWENRWMARTSRRGRLRTLRPTWLLDAVKQVLALDSGVPLGDPQPRRPLVSYGDTERPGLIALKRTRKD